MKKAQKVILLMIALALLAVLFASCKGISGSGTSGSGTSGTYYLFKDGQLDKTDYWTLNSDYSWTDSDGISGTYELNGTTITIFCFGMEFCDGTLEDGKLTVVNSVYYLESKAPFGTNDKVDFEKEPTPEPEHTHAYSDWSISIEATCTTEGMKTRTCSCGDKQAEAIPAIGHAYVEDFCETCGEMDPVVAARGAICTPEDLNKLVNSADTFTLQNDIDLAGIAWTPIEGFSGTLNGNGYTIKNLQITASGDYIGLFSYLTGKVFDLNIEDAKITVTGNRKLIGILCGYLDEGEVSNISVSGTVSAEKSEYVAGVAGHIRCSTNCTMQNVENRAAVTGKAYVGGVVGWIGGNWNQYSATTLTLKSFSNSGTIQGASECIGGIFGCLDSNYDKSSQIIKVYDVKNTGDVSGETYVGGIVGLATSINTASVIDGATCQANITAEAIVGCIAGQAYRVTLNNCSNQGSTLTATKYYIRDGEKFAYAGGIVGDGYLVKNSANHVPINYTSTGYHVGGIAGMLIGIGVGDLENLENHADITGYENVGGIAGSVSWSTSEKDSNMHYITDLSNYGNITTINGYAGGVFGCFQPYKSQLVDIYNEGDVIGTDFVGGIIGYGESETSVSLIMEASCKGDITGTAYVGCIAGYAHWITIDSCSNEGSTLTATKYVNEGSEKSAYVGGFVGSGYVAKNCTNKVQINYTGGGKYVGGIMGFSCGAYDDQTLTFDNLSNEAEVVGDSYVGGIFGTVWFVEDDWYYTNKYTFTDMKNSANVEGSGNFVGGVFGYINVYCDGGNSWLYITDAMNSGDITGKEFVGGIVGKLDKSGNSSFHGTGSPSGIFDPISTGTVIGTAYFGDIYGVTGIDVK